MLAYEDVSSAIDWLVAAFNFVEQERYHDGERVTHAVLGYRGGAVHLGWPGPFYQSPRHHAETCQASSDWQQVPWVIDGALVEVDDLESHLARATEQGAEVLRGPDDQPFGRLYSAADHEGHRWMFIQPS